VLAKQFITQAVKGISVFTALSLVLCCPVFAQNTIEKPVQVLPEISVKLLKGSLSKTQVNELTLPAALSLAVDENPSLKASSDRTRLSKAQYYTQLASFFPDIDGGFFAEDYNGRIQIFGNQGIDIKRNIRRPSIYFDFTLFDSGRRFLMARSAKRAYRAQQQDEIATRQQTLQQTALAYYELQRQINDISVAQKFLAESQTQLDMNVARFEAGVGTRLEVMQTKAAVAKAKLANIDATQGAQIAALRLNEILSLPAFVEVIPPDPQGGLQTLVPGNMGINEMLARAVENRPELKALAKRFDALKSLRKIAWTGLLPKVAFQIRSGGLGPSFNRTHSFDVTNFALNFSYKNLMVSTFTQYKEKSAEMDELLHLLEAQENAIRREISESFVNSLAKQAKLSAVKEELSASELALSDSMERLGAGVGNNLDVISSERSLSEARANWVAAIMEYNQAQVNLVHAMGLTSIDTLTKGISLP